MIVCRSGCCYKRIRRNRTHFDRPSRRCTARRTTHMFFVPRLSKRRYTGQTAATKAEGHSAEGGCSVRVHTHTIACTTARSCKYSQHSHIGSVGLGRRCIDFHTPGTIPFRRLWRHYMRCMSPMAPALCRTIIQNYCCTIAYKSGRCRTSTKRIHMDFEPKGRHCRKDRSLGTTPSLGSLQQDMCCKWTRRRDDRLRTI